MRSLFIVVTLILSSCASNKKEYPAFFEVRSSGFTNNLVTMELIEREDIICVETKEDKKTVKDTCKGKQGQVFFSSRKRAVSYSQEIARSLCEGEINPVSAELKREVAGKTPTKCHGSGNSGRFGYSWSETCVGGEDKYNRKVVMSYKCIESKTP